MNAGAKLAGFAAALAASFGGAAALGSAVGPIDVADGTTTHSGMTDVSNAGTATALQRGLAVAEAGYRLALDTTTVAAGSASSFAFTVLDDRGAPVTSFDELHQRRLHLIVLSRNLVGFHHLHPTMDAIGHWSVDLPALEPGSYRFFADFQPTGAENLTLGADVTVAGDVLAVATPAPAATFAVDDLVVALAGTPMVGDAELSFTVERDGAAVTTDPYLGASGHLVAIRVGDLAYLHVHPHDGTSPVITFTGEFPTAGTYRLFLDFSIDGTVRTAAFTVSVPDIDAPPTTHPKGH